MNKESSDLFSVVQFNENGMKLFESIPDFWFVDNEKSMCYWPPKGKSFKLRALKREKPGPGWTIETCIFVSGGYATFNAGLGAAKEKVEEFNTSSAVDHLDALNFRRKHPALALAVNKNNSFEHIFATAKVQRSKITDANDVSTAKSVENKQTAQVQTIKPAQKQTKTRVMKQHAVKSSKPSILQSVSIPSRAPVQKMKHTGVESAELVNLPKRKEIAQLQKQWPKQKNEATKTKTTDTEKAVDPKCMPTAPTEPRSGPPPYSNYLERFSPDVESLAQPRRSRSRSRGTSRSNESSISNSGSIRGSAYSSSSRQSSRFSGRSRHSSRCSGRSRQSSMRRSDRSRSRQSISNSGSQRSRHSSMRPSNRPRSQQSNSGSQRSSHRSRSQSSSGSSQSNSVHFAANRSRSNSKSAPYRQHGRRPLHFSRSSSKSSERDNNHNNHLLSNSTKRRRDFRSVHNSSDLQSVDSFAAIDRRITRMEVTVNKIFVMVGDIIKHANKDLHSRRENHANPALTDRRTPNGFTQPDFPIYSVKNRYVFSKMLKRKDVYSFMLEQEKEYCAPSKSSDNVVMTAYLKRFITLGIRSDVALKDPKGQKELTLFRDFNRVYNFLVDVMKSGYSSYDKRIKSTEVQTVLRTVWGRTNQMLNEQHRRTHK